MCVFYLWLLIIHLTNTHLWHTVCFEKMHQIRGAVFSSNMVRYSWNLAHIVSTLRKMVCWLTKNLGTDARACVQDTHQRHPLVEAASRLVVNHITRHHWCDCKRPWRPRSSLWIPTTLNRLFSKPYAIGSPQGPNLQSEHVEVPETALH